MNVVVMITMVAVAVVTMMVPMVGPSLVTLGECHSCLRLDLGASKGDSHGLTQFFMYVHILFSQHWHAHIHLVVVAGIGWWMVSNMASQEPKSL